MAQNLNGNIRVTTLQEAVTVLTRTSRAADAFLDLSNTAEYLKNEKLSDIPETHFNIFGTNLKASIAEEPDLLTKFLSFTYNLKPELDNENGSALDGTLVWLAEQFAESRLENNEMIGSPYQTFIFSKRDKNGEEQIIGTWSLVKTDRGAENKFSDGPPDALIGYFQINRDFRGQGYENVIINHMAEYISKVVNDQELSGKYDGKDKPFRVGLFTRSGLMNLAKRFHVVPETQVGGEGQFSDELLGVVSITPGIKLLSLPKTVHKMAQRLKGLMLAA